MNDAQRRYTTGEQELLSIVEMLKELKNILLGQDLAVHTDHKNILYGNLSNDRIAHWRLLIEEFSPRIEHIAGKDNIVADALSRMEANFKSEFSDTELGQVCAHAMSHSEQDYSYAVPKAKRKNLAKILHREHNMAEMDFPLSPETIRAEQQKDKKLLEAFKEKKEHFSTEIVESSELILFKEKIYVPSTLTERVLAWYHEYLVHPGTTRMEATLRQTLVWPNMRKDVKCTVRTCRKCQ